MEGDTPGSPRKKAKMEHSALLPPPPASTMHPSTPGAGHVAASGSDTLLDEQQKKEIRCGIIEYVSPDSLSFSGILKKRYAFFELSLTSDLKLADTPIFW